MSALDELKKINPIDMTMLEFVVTQAEYSEITGNAEQAAADLAALNARVKTAEKNWHKNEARLGKLQIVADALAEIVEYDTGDARHGLQSLAKARLAEYEKLKGAE